MAELRPNDKRTMWRFFLWWYKETYLVQKHERTLYQALPAKDVRLARTRFLHAFVLNGALHSGLALVLWSGAVSKLYSFPFLAPIPYSVRLGLTLAVPPLLAYLRFQDIFYEKELCDLAERWASNHPRSDV